MRSFVLRVAVTALALMAVPAASNAAWLNEFSGYTVLGQPSPRSDGVVNFAVYERNTALSFAQEFGGATGIGGLLTNAGADASANYIYFYSVVNTIPPSTATDATLINYYVQTSGRETSAGVLQGAAFTDNQTATTGTRLVGSTSTTVGSNQLLGNPTAVGSAADPQQLDDQPTYTITNETIGVRTATNAAGGSVNPRAATYTGTAIDPLYGNDSLRFTFSLPGNAYTTLMFFTSNYQPGYGGGVISGQGNSAGNSGGDVPVPTPEPGTLALALLGMPLLGLGYFRRRLSGKAGAEVTV